MSMRKEEGKVEVAPAPAPAPVPAPLPLPPLPQDAREEWERNQPDFRGKASFDLILRRIEATTGRLRKPGEVTPSTIQPEIKPGDEGDEKGDENAVAKRENVRDMATQTPTLASPYDPTLRRVFWWRGGGKKPLSRERERERGRGGAALLG